MSGDLAGGGPGTDLEERLRASFEATRVPPAPPVLHDRAAQLLSSDPADVHRSALRRAGAVWLSAAAVIVVLVVVGTALFVGAQPGPTPSPRSTAPSSAPRSPATVEAVVAYPGDGWTFDYPSTWTFYPFKLTASFFDTIGYLATLPVDTDAICDRSINSVSCDFRGYEMRPGTVVVELANWGTPMTDPVQFYDHPDQGTRVVVGGMPAVFSEERVSADRVRLTWMIARPDAFGNWIQIDADILGPGDGPLRRQVEGMIASFTFDPAPKPLAEGQGEADAIAALAVERLQQDEAAAYACFPAAAGTTKTATVEALPSATLKEPLPVRCSTRISRTDVGFWRLELVASWDAAADRSAGSATTVQWLFPDGAPSASIGSGDPIPYCCR